MVHISFITEQDENCIRRVYKEAVPYWYIQKSYEGDIRPIRGTVFDIMNTMQDIDDHFVFQYLIDIHEKIPLKFLDNNVAIEIQIREEVPKYKPLNKDVH